MTAAASPAAASPGLASLVAALDAAADPARAAHSARFFRTGPGEYGEGDVFIGLAVPRTRAMVKEHLPLAVDDAVVLLSSPIHEHRLAGLLALVARFRRASQARTRDDGERRLVHETYLALVAAGRVNSWDLVDVSSHEISGEWWRTQGDDDGAQLALARSAELWERRVAMISCLAWLRAGQAGPTTAVATILLRDPHDLIQKAVGWMLRELGKRVSGPELLAFLEANAGAMPRTMLSYAVEQLAPWRREHYRALPRR